MRFWSAANHETGHIMSASVLGRSHFVRTIQVVITRSQTTADVDFMKSSPLGCFSRGRLHNTRGEEVWRCPERPVFAIFLKTSVIHRLNTIGYHNKFC